MRKMLIALLEAGGANRLDLSRYSSLALNITYKNRAARDKIMRLLIQSCQNFTTTNVIESLFSDSVILFANIVLLQERLSPALLYLDIVFPF